MILHWTKLEEEGEFADTEDGSEDERVFSKSKDGYIDPTLRSGLESEVEEDNEGLYVG
jgi:hypothetical protein